MRRDEPFYTPERVARLLATWAEVCARADGGGRSAIVGAGSRSSGRPSDPLAGVVIVADITSAVARLRPLGLAHAVARERMATGGSLGAIARQLGRRKADVLQAYSAAVAAIVDMLEPGLDTGTGNQPLCLQWPEVRRGPDHTLSVARAA